MDAVFFDFDGVLTTDKYGSDTTNRYLGEAPGLDLIGSTKRWSVTTTTCCWAGWGTLMSGLRYAANWVWK